MKKEQEIILWVLLGLSLYTVITSSLSYLSTQQILAIAGSCV